MAKESKKSGSRKTKVKHKDYAINDIRIIGDNILYINGYALAYYILPLVNYSTISTIGIEHNIEDLSNLITNLVGVVPDVTFSIERIQRTVDEDNVRQNLIDSIKLFRTDYDMPEVFSSRITQGTQNFCLLAVTIKASEVTEIADKTFWETMKEVFQSNINKFLVKTNDDPRQLLSVEESVFGAIKDKCARATKELIFYNFASKLFPRYVIHYDEMQYKEENAFSNIMNVLSQTVIDGFDHFKLTNEGLSIFGIGDYEDTYGCMLDVQSLPDKIPMAGFPLNFPDDNIHTVLTIHCLKKNEALLKLKRTRSSDRYERDQAIEAGAEDEQIQKAVENIAIATYAIEELEEGDILCQFNVSFLVTGDTLSEVRNDVASLTSICKDKNIIVVKSITQALDFMDKYVYKKEMKKYQHMSSIVFPLCFQLNSGALVGDTPDKDGINGSPHIGLQPVIGTDAF